MSNRYLRHTVSLRLKSRFLLLFCLGVCLLPVRIAAQEYKFSLMELNVENLFDTIHDEGKNDYDFLPGGEYNWNGRKYWSKLGKLIRLFAAAEDFRPLDLIALCEVENDSCLKDLTRRTALRRMDYDFVITHSPDPRGMDVALLYQPLRFRPFRTDEIVVPYNPKREHATRNILHVGGMLVSGDTLDIFVCHLPSRSGGGIAADRYRYRAACLMREAVDSIFRERPNAAIILTGDFNDERRDNSLKKGLRVLTPKDDFSATDLVDLSEHYTHPYIRGSYKFQGWWNQLDHIIVSGAMLQPNAPLYTAPDKCDILTFWFLLEKRNTDKVRPRRTHKGTFYNGGISDHLPMRLRFYH